MTSLTPSPFRGPSFESFADFRNRFRELEYTYKDKALAWATTESKTQRTPLELNKLSQKIAQDTFAEFAAEVEKGVLPTDFVEDKALFLKAMENDFNATSKLKGQIKLFMKTPSEPEKPQTQTPISRKSSSESSSDGYHST